MKVLGGGQCHTALSVTADAFSDDAETALDDAGGEAVLTEHGEELAAEAEAEEDTNDENDD